MFKHFISAEELTYFSNPLFKALFQILKINRKMGINCKMKT